LRGILFDKDGTLLDFEATWTPVLKRLALVSAAGDAAKAAALLEAGGYIAETGKFRAGSVIGAGTTELIVALWHPDADVPTRADIVGRMDRAFFEHGGGQSVAIEGTAEAIVELALRGYILGVATNDATKAAIASLVTVDAKGHLAHVFGYDSVANAKPAPDMVLAFSAATGIPPAEIVVVGDNPHDLAMARAAGAGLAIGVISGNGTAEDLAPLADAVLPSIRELPAWLDQNRK
jgi:phosphoglycolate phosphatase